LAASNSLKKICRAAAWVCVASLCIAGESMAAQQSTRQPATVAKGSEKSIPALLVAADKASKNQDYATSAQLLEMVVAIDPNYKNAQSYLGWAYNNLRQFAKAEATLRKAIAVNPADPLAYNNLGQALAFQKKYDEAIAQYMMQIKINPKETNVRANLGRVYVLTKQYQAAIDMLEQAAAISPDDANIPFYQGLAYARLNEPEKAIPAFSKSAEMQPTPYRWNEVAYVMASEKLDLPRAEKYARSAIDAVALLMRDASLEHINKGYVSRTQQLAMYWDTLGWVVFQEGDLEEAENYVHSAVRLGPSSLECDHLAQIYEKQGRKDDAIRMYQMALAGEAPPTGARERLAALVAPEANIDALTAAGHIKLKELKTIAVKNSGQMEGTAEFWILLSPPPGSTEVKFVTGDQKLASLAKDLQGISFPNSFPDAEESKLFRRGSLSCAHSSPDCELMMVSSQAVPTEGLEPAPHYVPGHPDRIKLDEGSPKLKILKKVQPDYPQVVRDQRIEGKVVLHAILGKNGSVLSVDALSGDQELIEAARYAVKKWKYEPMIAEGKPVEVDIEIEVFFSLRR
jgi:TonB family protein